MSQSSSEDPRLHATELKMRRALGLQEQPSPRVDTSPPVLTTNRQHRPARRFVRDGEVQVTHIHRDHGQDEASGTNQLEVARQALKEQTEARERAERSLNEVQALVRDLQTKLAHERFAKDEALQAVQRAEADRQTTRRALEALEAEQAAEHALRIAAEQGRDEAIAACLASERQVREMTVVSPVRKAQSVTTNRESTARTKPKAISLPTEGEEGMKPVRRRGRPSAATVQATVQEESEPVQWWVKGWQRRYR